MTPSEFAVLMQRELDANAHKGIWAEWKPNIPHALRELEHHRMKVIGSLLYEKEIDRERLTEFCADVANIAMKIAETFGGKP